MKTKILKFEMFMKTSPTCHINYKRKDFAHCKKPIMANKLLSTNLERFLSRIKPQLAR